MRIGSDYRYATLSTSDVSESQLHLIIGTYDGNGKIRLWIDGSDAGVSESATLTQGVVLNDVPIRLGADPEGLNSAVIFLMERFNC